MGILGPVVPLPKQPIGWMFSRLNQRSDAAGGANGILKALVTLIGRCHFWEFHGVSTSRGKRGSTQIRIVLSNPSRLQIRMHIHIHIIIIYTVCRYIKFKMYLFLICFNVPLKITRV